MHVAAVHQERNTFVQQSSSPPNQTIRHATSIKQLVDTLATDPYDGLKDEEVVERRANYGPNRLAESPQAPSWKRFVGRFAELIVWILIAAAFIAVLLDEWLDASAIIAIVLISSKRVAYNRTGRPHWRSS